MKRLFRVLFRVLGVPLVILIQGVSFVSMKTAMFIEWLFEWKDYYTWSEFYDDEMKDYNSFWRNFFK